jgi:hypothetical protein
VYLRICCVSPHLFVYLHLRVYVYTRDVYLRDCVYTCISVFVCIRLCVYVYLRVCVYTFVCIRVSLGVMDNLRPLYMHVSRLVSLSLPPSLPPSLALSLSRSLALSLSISSSFPSLFCRRVCVNDAVCGNAVFGVRYAVCGIRRVRRVRCGCTYLSRFRSRYYYSFTSVCVHAYTHAQREREREICYIYSSTAPHPVHTSPNLTPPLPSHPPQRSEAEGAPAPAAAQRAAAPGTNSQKYLIPRLLYRKCILGH